jgi:glycerol-3-phosphate acyltransferase PlsY
MEYLYILLCVIFSYCIGSIPTGLILGKIFKKEDIRNLGSGNIGATNMFRVYGFKLGFITFLLDALKSFLIIATIIFFDIQVLLYFNGFTIVSFYGLSATIGHCYPIYLKKGGGKAVASSFGTVLALEPYVALVALVVFVIVVLITRIVSLTSFIGSFTILALTPINYFVLYKDLGFENGIISSLSILFLIVLLLSRHIENIKRLLNKKEYKFNNKKL